MECQKLYFHCDTFRHTVIRCVFCHRFLLNKWQWLILLMKCSIVFISAFCIQFNIMVKWFLWFDLFGHSPQSYFLNSILCYCNFGPNLIFPCYSNHVHFVCRIYDTFHRSYINKEHQSSILYVFQLYRCRRHERTIQLRLFKSLSVIKSFHPCWNLRCGSKLLNSIFNGGKNGKHRTKWNRNEEKKMNEMNHYVICLNAMLLIMQKVTHDHKHDWWSQYFSLFFEQTLSACKHIEISILFEIHRSNLTMLALNTVPSQSHIHSVHTTATHSCEKQNE